MIFSRFISRSKSGLTLIEVIIYVALLALIAVLIANFLIQITATYGALTRKREVVSNARLLLETLRNATEAATEVYTPTSAFNQTIGQLSLLSAEGAGPGHTSAYADFWVDNGRLMARREGGADEALSGANVRVTQFYLERITQTLGREAVRITLQVDSANTRSPATVALSSTFALRGNY